MILRVVAGSYECIWSGVSYTYFLAAHHPLKACSPEKVADATRGSFHRLERAPGVWWGMP